MIKDGPSLSSFSGIGDEKNILVTTKMKFMLQLWAQEPCTDVLGVPCNMKLENMARGMILRTYDE